MRNVMLLVLICCLGVMSTAWAADKLPSKVIYRYKNNQGVTVMDATIPPEFVSKGYEILTRSGKVIKVVAPSLAGEEAEHARTARLIREEQTRVDVQLRRSYSNVKDIDAAKARNLDSLRGNIKILETNKSAAENRLQASLARAAELERSGRKVPEDVLKNISSLEQEIKNINLQVKQREVEYQSVSDRFDQDRKRFLEITKDN
jgi:hypothetical protein